MTINEFRWGIKPAVPGHWRETLSHDGFEIEIADDWIEVRKEDNGERDAQQKRAQQIVEGIVRKIGLYEKAKFTATFGSLARFDADSNRRDTTAFISDSVKASVHMDIVLTSADGTVIADSKKEREAELLRFADLCSGNENLRAISDYLLEYHSDPQKKLAPLYDIIERADKIFGSRDKAAIALGVSKKTISRTTGVINDKTIRSGRHRGQELIGQRDPSPAESQLCEAVAKQIVNEYAKMVENGMAPK